MWIHIDLWHRNLVFLLFTAKKNCLYYNVQEYWFDSVQSHEYRLIFNTYDEDIVVFVVKEIFVSIEVNLYILLRREYFIGKKLCQMWIHHPNWNNHLSHGKRVEYVSVIIDILKDEFRLDRLPMYIINYRYVRIFLEARRHCSAFILNLNIFCSKNISLQIVRQDAHKMETTKCRMKSR